MTHLQESSCTASVTVIRCRTYDSREVLESLERIFALLGGIEAFISRGDRVLIKPNLIVPAAKERPAQTHPAVILSLAKMLKDFGARPFVGDSPAWSNAAGCIRALELEEPLKKLQVPVVQLDVPVRVKIEGSRIGISRRALEADAVINLPKFKSHQQLGATFAVKNMFGCVAGKEKAFWHFSKGGCEEDFCRMLLGIYRHINPVLNIIDGIVCMEGQGPINGTPRPLGYLIAGRDPIACEYVCCRLIGMNPADLPILRTAAKVKFGASDPHNFPVLGDFEPEFVCTNFRQAAQTPLRFTFPRICKSVAKQICVLVKQSISPKK